MHALPLRTENRGHRFMPRAEHKLNVVCTTQALNAMRKYIFHALSAMNLDAERVVVSRCDAEQHAAMSVAIYCRAEQEAALHALLPDLHRQHGVRRAYWRTPRQTALSA